MVSAIWLMMLGETQFMPPLLFTKAFTRFGHFQFGTFWVQRSFSQDSEAIGVLASSIRRVACLRFGAWLPAPLQGAAARGCCLRSGAWLVPLQGVAGCCWRVLLSYARCRRASLQGAAMSVRVLFALWSLVAGAAAMCCCRVLFRLRFEAWLLVPL